MQLPAVARAHCDPCCDGCKEKRLRARCTCLTLWLNWLTWILMFYNRQTVGHVMFAVRPGVHFLTGTRLSGFSAAQHRWRRPQKCSWRWLQQIGCWMHRSGSSWKTNAACMSCWRRVWIESRVLKIEQLLLDLECIVADECCSLDTLRAG